MIVAMKGRAVSVIALGMTIIIELKIKEVENIVII